MACEWRLKNPNQIGGKFKYAVIRDLLHKPVYKIPHISPADALNQKPLPEGQMAGGESEG